MSHDLTLPWCTYETRFSNGLYYRGKGKTANVTNGTYVGSGHRLRLALLFYAKSSEISRTTTVLSTHATETQAYDQEEQLIPIELLMDPMCLNMHSGGLRGKYKTHGMLVKQINAEKKRLVREKRAASAKIKKQKAAEELKALKQKLKEKT